MGFKFAGSLVDKIKYDLEIAMSDDNHADLHFTLDHRFARLCCMSLSLVVKLVL